MKSRSELVYLGVVGNEGLRDVVVSKETKPLRFRC